MNSGCAGQLRDANDRVFDVTRRDHHEVGEFVDDNEKIWVGLEFSFTAGRKHDLVIDDGLVEVVDVPEPEAGQVVVTQVHLLDHPLKRLRGLFRIRDDGGDEMRYTGVCREFDPLRVDQHHAHVTRLGAHEQTHDHRVHEARLARTG